MMFGLSKETISALHSVFRKYPEIESVIIYGSRAKGNYREGSDIDLTLIGNQLTTDHVLRISADIDDLNLPYLFDLSVYHQLDSVSLKQHIERVGKTFFPLD
ncbi:MAG TPA: nucleotidyltransferase domain-containing protein [Bacteroidales bacterium]|nr:nucleotidyltransferase domain-containing protein [Bacteroidales bacterium]